VYVVAAVNACVEGTPAPDNSLGVYVEAIVYTFVDVKKFA
jgi:hypothetical protein